MTEQTQAPDEAAKLPIPTRRQEAESAYAAIVDEERRALVEKNMRHRSMRLFK
ncbi:hypothetical protein [Rhizobium sp. LjRoot254]|uniref:hypothetical protein n=1 Tax=Rhizobium sp. LjRoot254 TaxID=3342297 RepID=UPI003ED1382B